MKKAFVLTAIFTVFLFLATSTHAQMHQLIKKWETDSVMKVPESVLFDAENNVLYVSNIDGQPWEKDGKGSIGKVGLDGKVIAAEWVTGLNAPKGMALYKNMLWVADLDELAVIDIKAGTISNRVKIEGAHGLNDVTVDKKGVVYVSDSKDKKVYRVENGKSEVFLADLQGPNGLFADDDDVYLLDNGSLYKVKNDDKKMKLVTEGMEGGTDGVEKVKGKDYIVSAWSGVVYYVNEDGTKEKLLDTREQKINSADIGYDAKNRIVYVPTFFKNSVVAYELK
ncbi:MAG: ATP/GTP-binding protein [Bacteroidota bacterium]|nr:ATP/GTP-binding protein [Bacteroidota bacterium]